MAAIGHQETRRDRDKTKPTGVVADKRRQLLRVAGELGEMGYSKHTGDGLLFKTSCHQTSVARLEYPQRA